jgi:YD repeat-containing protein
LCFSWYQKHLYRNMKISINTPVLLTALVSLNTAFCQTKSTNKCLETKFQSTRNGNVETLKTKKYNTSGQLLSETEVLTSKFLDNFNRETVYSYDAKGNKIKQTSIEDGKVKSIIQFSFDKNNQLTEEKEIKSSINKNSINDNDTPANIKIFNGSEIVQKLYFDGKESGQIKSVLNTKGDVLQKETKDSKGNISFIEINEYATNGALLKQEFNDKIAKTTTTSSNIYENNRLKTENFTDYRRS